VTARDLDPASLYEQERLRFIAMLRAVPTGRLSTPVAATPGWTIRDVVAHVVGITADLNAQRFGDGDPDSWTADQLAQRADHPLEKLVVEWDREAPSFESGLRLFGHQFGAHFLADLLQHGFDVAAALGQGRRRDDECVAVGLSFYLESFAESLDGAGAGAVEMIASAERHLVGTGDVVASVRASRHELFRALGGRRTIAEIAALDWSGNNEAIIGLFSRYPPPLQSLGE
jgi:uncharacterized protein (TIGR03083 family)